MDNNDLIKGAIYYDDPRDLTKGRHTRKDNNNKTWDMPDVLWVHKYGYNAKPDKVEMSISTSYTRTDLIADQIAKGYIKAAKVADEVKQVELDDKREKLVQEIKAKQDFSESTTELTFHKKLSYNKAIDDVLEIINKVMK